jgi:hypothetical protein
MSFPPYRGFKVVLPGGFLLLVPFRACRIERMIGDLEKVVTDLNNGVIGKEQGVNAIA